MLASVFSLQMQLAFICGIFFNLQQAIEAFRTIEGYCNQLISLAQTMLLRQKTETDERLLSISLRRIRNVSLVIKSQASRSKMK